MPEQIAYSDMSLDEQMIIRGRAHGSMWARTWATASELVRADRLWSGGFREETMSLDPCVRFIEAIRPDNITGPIGPLHRFKQELGDRGISFLQDAGFVAGFCYAASLTWRAGHFPVDVETVVPPLG